MKLRTLKNFLAICLIAVAGCAEILKPLAMAPGSDDLQPIARPVSGGQAPPAAATTVEDFDTTTPAERLAAVAHQNAGADGPALGSTVASLGDPSKPGFWLETPLVTVPMSGRVVYVSSGVSVAVELIPTDGPATAGSRISLPAMRLLGAPLTALAELSVFSR